MHKSLYGLKQFGRAWYRKFPDVMITLKFKNVTSDTCLFVSEKYDVFILLYVDDILIICHDLSKITELKLKLSNVFQMKDLGEVENFLGLHIHRDYNTNEIEVSMQSYVEKILKNYNMESCNPCKTPIDVNHKIVINTSCPTINPFRELIGSLQYLSLVGRPDISVAVNYFSKFQENPDEQHFLGLKRILRYLKGTLDYKLVYKRQENCEKYS